MYPPSLPSRTYFNYVNQSLKEHKKRGIHPCGISDTEVGRDSWFVNRGLIRSQATGLEKRFTFHEPRTTISNGIIPQIDPCKESSWKQVNPFPLAVKSPSNI